MFRNQIAMSVVMAVAVAGQVVMAADATDEVKPLSASIALGVNVNDGNTDNSMGTASFTLDRLEDSGNSMRLAADLAYGETEGDKSTDNGSAQFDYRYLLSERSYAGFNASAKYDDIADLDYRFIVSPGLGYYVMKKSNVFMTAEAGPAWISEKKGGETSDDLALRVAERYERVTETNAKWWQSLEYLPHVDDFDIYILNAEIGVEAPVSASLNIRLSVKDTYDSNPAPDRENNDVSVIGALAYSLF